ncbi:MAG: hypothetical protein ACREMZ_16440 [Gemmatimonadales bacterium]
MAGNSTYAFAMACAGIIVTGCTEPAFDSLAPADQPTATVAKPGDPGAASDRILYQVRLGALGDSRSHGVMLIEIVGGHLTVSVHAAGLEPLQHIPQHIHLNPTCDPGGGILLNLDANLSVPIEGPGVGTAYPVANAGGVVNYYASRSLSDLLQAVNTHLGLGLTSVEALLAWLDLDNRNAHMHVAFGPPFPAVNCGDIERLN